MTRPADGFSLVEILVVVTLIGIAAALSIPKMASMQNQTKVQRAAQAMQMEVQQAFAIAHRNRSPVKFSWNGATTQLRVTNQAGTVVYRRLGVGTGGGYGLTASEVTVTPSTLTVFPSGLAADTLVIFLSKSGHTKRIWVSKAGMVRVK